MNVRIKGLMLGSALVFLAGAPALAQDVPAPQGAAVAAAPAEDPAPATAVPFRLYGDRLMRDVTLAPDVASVQAPAGSPAPSGRSIGVGGRFLVGRSEKGAGATAEIRQQIGRTDPRTPGDDRDFYPSPGGATAQTYPWVTTIIGQFGFYHLGGENVITGLGGGRLCRHLTDQFALFGQVLAGILHFPESTDFALQPGGGVTWFLNGKSYRFDISVEFPIDFFNGGHETNTQFGFTFVLPFGSK